MTRETLELLLKLVEAGSAGVVAVALILTVIVILGHSRKDSAANRKTHGEEVDRLLATHEKTCAQIAAAVTLSGKETAGAIRDLRDELLWERERESKPEDGSRKMEV